MRHTLPDGHFIKMMLISLYIWMCINIIVCCCCCCWCCCYFIVVAAVLLFVVSFFLWLFLFNSVVLFCSIHFICFKLLLLLLYVFSDKYSMRCMRLVYVTFFFVVFCVFVIIIVLIHLLSSSSTKYIYLQTYMYTRYMYESILA